VTTEKRIYEWLRPELKGLDWAISLLMGGCGELEADAFIDREDGPRLIALPPLDMNTAFGECIPKLTREGCDVKFSHGHWDLQPMREAWHGPYHAREDFWLAVVEWLAAREGK